MTPAAILSILVTAKTASAQKNLTAVQGQLERTEKKASRMSGVLKTAIKAGALSAAGGLVYAVKKAADFEQQMDSLGAVSDASAKQMKRLEDQAMRTGAATKFSALESAAAQTELAKGGLSVQQILKGGLNSALALAAAGEMDLAQAAETTANAIKLFGLRGEDAMKVADALATAANRTTADVEDFAMALKMGGSVAKMAGLSLTDTVVVLEALAEAGIKNSDAGTSMKSFFLNITRDAPKAREAAAALGLEIFKQNGELKSLPAISKNMRAAFGDLTKEQFLNKAGVIAGSDAVRTLWALYDAGPQKLRELQDATEKSGTAAQTAKEKQDNLKGALENLQGSVETIAISLGKKFIPALTDVVKKVTRILSDKELTSGERLAKLGEFIGDTFIKALPKIVTALRKVGLGAAEAFWEGFKELPLLGKILTTALVAKLVMGRGGRQAFRSAGMGGGSAFMGGVRASIMGRAGAAAVAALSEKLAIRGGLLGKVGQALSERGATPKNPVWVAMVGGGAPGVPGDGKSKKTISGTAREVGEKVLGPAAGAAAATKGKALMTTAKKVGGFLVKRAIPGIGAIYTTIEVADALGLMDKDVRQSPREIKATTGAKPRRTPEDRISLTGGYTQLGPSQGKRPKPVKDESAAAAAAGAEQMAKRAREAMKVIRELKNTSITDLDTLTRHARENFKMIGDDIGIHTRRGKKAAGENLEAAATAIARSVGKGRTSTKKAMEAVESLMRSHSKIGKERLSANLAKAADNIQKSMDAGKISVKQGTQLIEQFMIAALQNMGFSKKQALMVRKGQDPYTGKAIGGKQNITNKQRGGLIPGTGDGDKVPVMAEPGEGFINKRAVRALGGGAAINAINRAVPRFQQGGWVGDSPAGLNAAVKSMALWAMKKYGASASDTTRPAGTRTSTGGISDHSVGAAVDLTSGNMMAMAKGLEAAFGAKIKQLIYTPLGYSLNYGERVPPIAADDHYDHVHLAAIGEAVKGMLTDLVAPTLNRIKVDGPDSLLKGTVQRGLDIGIAGAQSVLDKVARDSPSSPAFDIGGPVPAGVLNKAQLAALWIQAGGPKDAAKIMAAIALAESGGDPSATGPMTSYGFQAAGLWQIHPPQPGSYDPLQNAIQAVAKYKAGGFSPWEAYTNGSYVKFLKKGGPIGYAGDSLGQGTIGPLRDIFGEDRNIEGRVSQGKNPAWGLDALRALGKKKSQYVFDFGSNIGGKGIIPALRQANQFTGDQPLHTFTLNAGEVDANKKIRSLGGDISVIDWARKHGVLSDGVHGDYGNRAKLLAASIKKAAAATEKPNKPFNDTGIKKRKHRPGNQAPTLDALHNTVNELRYGEGGKDALGNFLRLVRETGMPTKLATRIEGLTDQIAILDDYATRAGQLTVEDAAGNVIPGSIAGRDEISFLTEELTLLLALRNKLIEAAEKLAARREQLKELRETAKKHFDYYQRAVVTWGHRIRVETNKLEELRKHPKKNKEKIADQRKMLMSIKAEQLKTVATRDALRDKIIPQLGDKRSTLGDDRTGVLDQLAEVHGLGSPLDVMTTEPVAGVLGGTILTTQLRLAELKAPPVPIVAEGATEADDLLKEIGRMTVLRSAVEKLHEITLRDFPEFDRLGVPFGGKFAEGGIVPGPMGAPRMILAHGGETVTPPNVTPVIELHFASGMEWLERFIDVRVDGATRRMGRNASRSLPGAGGGRLG